MVSKKEVADLEKLVNTAEKKFKGIIKFVEKVTHNLGELTHYCIRDCHIESTRKLNMNGFHFIYDGPHNMYDCDSITIQYKGETVLEMDYRGSGPEISTYIPGKWENNLLEMVKNQKQVISDYKKEHKKEVEDRLNRAQTKKARDEISYDAMLKSRVLNARASARSTRLTKEEIEEQKLEKKRKELEEKSKKLGIK